MRRGRASKTRGRSPVLPPPHPPLREQSRPWAVVGWAGLHTRWSQPGPLKRSCAGRRWLAGAGSDSAVISLGAGGPLVAVPRVPARRRPAPDLQSPASEWALGGRAAWERGWSYGVQSVGGGGRTSLLFSGCQEPCFGRGVNLCKVTQPADGPAGTALSRPASGGCWGEVRAGQGGQGSPGQCPVPGTELQVASRSSGLAGSSGSPWRPHPTAGHGPLGGAK